MSINGNRKGKIGEREWRDELRAQGFTARRGQQFAGGPDSPDVICPELGQYHMEVKRVEALNVTKAMAQAAADAGSKTPVVAHRRNKGKWLVTMLADDWFKLLREALPVPLPDRVLNVERMDGQVFLVSRDQTKPETPLDPYCIRGNAETWSDGRDD